MEGKLSFSTDMVEKKRNPNLDGGCEIKLASLASFHVELESNEPVAADLLFPIFQAAVGLRPDVRKVDCLPLQIRNQVPHLAFNKPNPLELILLTLTGSLKHNEVAILGEKVGRLKKFVPSRLNTKSLNALKTPSNALPWRKEFPHKLQEMI